MKTYTDPLKRQPQRKTAKEADPVEYGVWKDQNRSSGYQQRKKSQGKDSGGYTLPSRSRETRHKSAPTETNGKDAQEQSGKPKHKKLQSRNG